METNSVPITIGEILYYVSYNKEEEIVKFGKRAPEKRKVIAMFTNIKGKRLVEWESKTRRGVCLPTTWQDWRDQVNENKRRGLTVWRAAV